MWVPSSELYFVPLTNPRLFRPHWIHSLVQSRANSEMPSTEVLSNASMKNPPHFKPMTSTAGSVPLIVQLTEEERVSRPFPSNLRSKFVPTSIARSVNCCGSPPNIGCFQQRFLRPARPALPRFIARASSADPRGHSGPWTASNSPTRENLLNFRKDTSKPTSSELSLCSSPSNGLDDASHSADVSAFKGQPHAVAQYDFDTRIDGDLQFRAGDIILLQESIDGAWYRGRSLATGQVGIFPVNHVTIRNDLDGTPPAKFLTNKSQVTEGDKDVETNAPASGVIESVPTPSADATNSLLKIGKIDVSAFEMKRAGSDGSFKFSRGSPVRPPVLPVKPDVSSLHRFKTDQNQSIRSSTPPVILCWRPRSNTTVSQLAHTLEQRGVAINRATHLPVGARALFPSACKQSGAFADVHKQSTCRSDGESHNRSSLNPLPRMVKTPLVAVAHESAKMSGGLKMDLAGMASDTDVSLNMAVACGRNNAHSIPGKGRESSSVTTMSDINLRNRLIDQQRSSVLTSARLRVSHSSIDDTSSSMCVPDEFRGSVLSSNDHPTSSQITRGKSTVDMNSIDTTTTEVPEAESCSFNTTNQATLMDASRRSRCNYRDDLLDIENSHPREHAPNFVIGGPNEILAYSNGNQWLLVLYDYTAAEPGDLTVKAGHVIRCLTPLASPASIHDVDITPDCWLDCVTWFNVKGQVPSTFVRRILDCEELERWMQCRPRAKVLYEFNAEVDGDLELKVGDLIYLHEAVDANWYRGENATTGHKGMFPAPFVRVLHPL